MLNLNIMGFLPAYLITELAMEVEVINYMFGKRPQLGKLVISSSTRGVPVLSEGI
jgi:hypothetical protein